MSKPGRPNIPDELKRVPYSSRMSKPLLDWLRSQPEPMTKIILVDDIKTLIKKSRAVS